MKFNKYLAIALLATTTLGFMSSCSDDDDNLGEAPRLFRPIASLETSNNTIIATWDNIAGATSYNLSLYRVTGVDENGENIYALYKQATCTGSPYVFEDLEWDEKYKLEISCASDTKESKTYESNDASVPYISSLKTVKTIDNAARITWDQSGKKIRAIVAIPEDGGDPIVKKVNDATYENGFVDISGLTSETMYTFKAYADSETFNNDTYAGRLTGTTSKPIDFDTEYGVGMWLDIRDWEDSEAKDTLKTEEFWAQLQDGMTVILRGDFDYKVNNSHGIDKSVRFVTAATLGGNARFINSGGLTLAKNVNVGFIEFNNVDFYSDKAIEGGGYEVRTTNTTGFGGRQVFNINGTNSTLGKIQFKGCHIEGYRAVVRAQADGDNINNVVFERCVINGIGDQGVVTTNNKACDFQNIKFKNCTITNIVMLTDLRASVSAPTMTIENCTFCYAPIETTAKADTPMFRFNANPVNLTITNTLFGPSMATDGSAGSNIQTYTAGTAGSIFLNGTDALVSVSKSFKTNFKWTEIGADLKTYPIDGLIELSMDEIKLWQAPANDDFKIIGNIGEDGIGDSRWF